MNSADYGVAQTRRRLIIRATLNGLLPPLPTPTPWVGWYEAIEDLIPSLPPSQFAQWQLDRLPAGLWETQFVEGTPVGPRPPTCGTSAEPAVTINSGGGGRVHRAFLCGVQGEGGELHRAGVTVPHSDAPRMAGAGAGCEANAEGAGTIYGVS